MTAVALDTSILVAALLPRHSDHQVATDWLKRARNGDLKATVATHGLAELYATLTARSANLSVRPSDALRLIRDLIQSVELVELGTTDYLLALSLIANHQLVSGVVYDALHYVAAVKVRADFILTKNLRDFHRLCTTPGFVRTI